MALEALAAGKHVLCSAPLATSVEAAERLIEAAKAADRRLFCVLHQRFIPAHVRTRALLAEGGIGDPVFGSVSVQVPQESEEGLLEAERLQAIDTLQSFVGPVRRVGAMRGGGGPASESLSLEFQTGALGQITLITSGAERITAERRLTGPEGTILIRDNPEDEMPLVVLQGDGFFPVKLKVPPDVREFAIMAAMEHLLACLEQGTPEAVTTGEALSALRVAVAAEEAARQGCVVMV